MSLKDATTRRKENFIYWPIWKRLPLDGNANKLGVNADVSSIQDYSYDGDIVNVLFITFKIVT